MVAFLNGVAAHLLQCMKHTSSYLRFALPAARPRVLLHLSSFYRTFTGAERLSLAATGLELNAKCCNWMSDAAHWPDVIGQGHKRAAIMLLNCTQPGAPTFHMSPFDLAAAARVQHECAQPDRLRRLQAVP